MLIRVLKLGIHSVHKHLNQKTTSQISAREHITLAHSGDDVGFYQNGSH